MKQIQAFVAAPPKSGVSWLNMAVAQYLIAAHRLNIEVDYETAGRVAPYVPGQSCEYEIPLFCFSHGLPDQTEATAAKHLVLMLDHPYTMAASRYFYRNQSAITGAFDFAVNSPSGLASTRAFLNAWASEVKRRNGLVLTLQEFTQDRESTLRKLLAHCDLLVDPEAMATAVRKSPGMDFTHQERGTRHHYESAFTREQLAQMRPLLLAGLSKDASDLLKPFHLPEMEEMVYS